MLKTTEALIFCGVLKPRDTVLERTCEVLKRGNKHTQSGTYDRQRPFLVCCCGFPEVYIQICPNLQIAYLQQTNEHGLNYLSAKRNIETHIPNPYAAWTEYRWFQS